MTTPATRSGGATPVPDDERSPKVDLRSEIAKGPRLPSLKDAHFANPMDCVVARLKPRLQVIFASLTMTQDDAADVLTEAHLTLTAKRREIHNADKWLLGNVRLRSILYWRQRQRRTVDAVDRTIAEILDDSEAPYALREGLRGRLAEIIARLPNRCRNVLRLRYGLTVETDQLSVRLGQRRASVRKVTDRCLSVLSQAIVDLAMQQDGVPSLVESAEPEPTD